MNCLIIAAGNGSRLSEMEVPKPLVTINNIPLIAHVIHNVVEAGIKKFTVVIGYERVKIEAELRTISKNEGVFIEIIFNPEWKQGNGLSVLAAKKSINSSFVLLMSDHIFHANMLRELLSIDKNKSETILAIDTKIKDNPLIDLDDVTRVHYLNDKIIQIGKHIEKYNAFDTGIFYSSPKLFTALEKSIAQGNTSLSGGMSQLIQSGLAKVYPLKEALWIDVDTPEMLQKATKLINNGSLC